MSSFDNVFCTNVESVSPYHIIPGETTNDYESKVVQTYCEDPERWRKVIGDTLLFQFGIYDDPASKPPISLDESGIRYFDRQLLLAGLETKAERPSIRRILDIGCGWGYILKYLAERFPECTRLDGVNISEQQLQYCAKFHAKYGLSERINLYLCNAQDIDRLPDPQELYDLVIIRGVISHFPNLLYEKAMSALFKRVSAGGQVIISDNLYNMGLDNYKSDIPDTIDRLACANRKTPSYFRQVLEKSGFVIKDMRVLPSNIDVVHWLLDVKTNIERNFPEGVNGPLEELRVLAENFSVAQVKNYVSTYSVIAQRL
ncbi:MULTISPECIES: SAM-dependent methyltransferase [unclassified Photorhabdus]|uniref:SAM-dependent methyltransferase n=1 Tax=unclassified Photorhabdus TaxID=2620880 RepID=UPI000DCF025B|nr:MULTISPECIES: class I SAM-dependent methyltransferase [unclassified Photorhabdus]RAW95465.1 methyltransferase type 12 [Photorhabdus sp. S9-53]RAW95639.1 methyltransferase type 12 [Photorhabdus sp. S10-54]RAW99717.1 methyltransferase type 12 [Photorhabdus sp. S8-52]